MTTMPSLAYARRTSSSANSNEVDAQPSPTAQLAEFAANLRLEEIPVATVQRAEELFLDWFASALAGKGGSPVEAMERFARMMGPESGGASEVLISRRMTTPLFAALVNAAASHFVEQDDVHTGSVFHPAAVVFPAALAAAQSERSSGADLIAAAVAGYEIGIRVGEFLGRSHYEIFHTTGTAGTIAAAAAAGRILGLNSEQMRDAFGSAGTQAAGLWEFLRDAADSKQLHTAHAAACGLTSAYLAREGFTGAKRILEGPQGMAAGMSRDADANRLTQGLKQRWATLETSFKLHSSCRHTHPAADAFLDIVRAQGLRPQDIVHVTAHVHQGALDVLGTAANPKSVHQAKFSMGTVLGLLAFFGAAGVKEFDQHFNDSRIVDFRRRVEMQFDPEVDRLYPARWIGKVTIITTNGHTLLGRCESPKGDPDNPMTRRELEQKALSLANYSGAASAAEMHTIFRQIWSLPTLEKVGPWLS